jgi:acyl-CoA thioester hydrolase
VVELFVERLGNTSLTIGHRILAREDDTILYADGNVVMVWIDKQRGQPAPLPGAVRNACALA